MTLSIAIAGSTGRMGQTLVQALNSRTDCRVAHAGGLHDSAETLFAQADAVIDFTAPDYSAAIAQEATKGGKVHVIGTTGFTPAQQAEIVQAAKHARIVQSANYSLGVNVLEALAEQAARILADDYDIEIDEMHHRMKKDSPSGTALMLGRAAAKGRGMTLPPVNPDRNGERARGDIGFSVRRGGEVIGDHTVTLAGPGERLELVHKASSRDIYAHGAIRAALWAAGQKPGLYSMRDVLGLG